MNPYGRVKYNDRIIRYRYENAQNDEKDCRVDMFYSSVTSILSFTDEFLKARTITIDESLQQISDTSNTTIYDKVYENDNDNKKRFKTLKQVRTFNGNIVTLLIDNEKNTLLLTRMLDTVNPDLVKNKHLEFKFTPIGMVDPTANYLSSITLNTDRPLATIAPQIGIKDKIGVVNLKVYAPYADKVSYKMDMNINDTHKVRTDMGILTCFSIPTDALYMDKSDFNVLHMFDYEGTLEGLIPSSNVDKIDTIYIPIS